jgi:hypothetical protein
MQNRQRKWISAYFEVLLLSLEISKLTAPRCSRQCDLTGRYAGIDSS